MKARPDAVTGGYFFLGVYGRSLRQRSAKPSNSWSGLSGNISTIRANRSPRLPRLSDNP